MRFVIFLIIISICGCKPANKRITCSCFDNEWPNFHIKAAADSLIICDTTHQKIVRGHNEIIKVYNSKLDYLTQSENSSGGSEKFIDCKTGNIIRHEFGPYHIRYDKKSLIIKPIRMFEFWDTITKPSTWRQDYSEVYYERIFAQSDSIIKTPKKLILVPPFINKKALNITLNLHDSIKNLDNKDSIQLWVLQEQLLTCALNGDNKSEKYLFNFMNTFPEYKIEKHNLERYNESIELLKNYKTKHNNR